MYSSPLISCRKKKTGQIFSVDVVIAVIVFISIIVTSAWYWDSTKEKIRIYETRNTLELAASTSASVLINTVGDPPNWHQLPFDEDEIYSIGIGKNRAWVIDEDKASQLETASALNYTLLKKILGVRGPGYEIYLNISKFDPDTSISSDIAIVGLYPNSSTAHVVNINRFALSDKDDSWVNIRIMVWNTCEGPECY